MMADLEFTDNKNCNATSSTAIGERNSSTKASLNFMNTHQSNNANIMTTTEPSFHQRYPEGRERLLALAESTKCPPQNGVNLRRSSPLNRHSAATSCSSNVAQGKPKMGLKDVRNRAAAFGRWNHSSPVTANVSVMYSSEQSLPDKLSQAIKGGISAFRGGHSNAKVAGGGAVAADDVLYFSSSSNSASSHGGGAVEFRKPKFNTPLAKPAIGAMSRSIEKLDAYDHISPKSTNMNNGKLSIFNDEHKLDRPKNLVKVKDYSYGMNLEDLKKMYKSLPDCSTPVNDEEDGEMRLNQTKADNFETDESDVTNIDSARNDDVSNYRNGHRDTATVASYRRLTVDDSDGATANARPAIALVDNDGRYPSKYQCDHHSDHDHQQRRHYTRQPHCGIRSCSPMMHARQASTDSASSPTEDRRIRVTVQATPEKPSQLKNPDRASVPCGVDFRDSCGSPTDSGYRSVPRNDELSSDQPTKSSVTVTSTGQAALVTSRTPLYTAMPKSIFSLTGTHLQQPLDQVRPTESASCNILMITNNNGSPNYGCCASATAVIQAPSPAQQSNGKPSDSSSGRRPKSRPRNGGMYVARIGSVPPLIHHPNIGVGRHSLDDTAANGTVPCHSPYSDLSSPSYGTSSSGASSSAAATGGQPAIQSGLGKINGSVSALGQQSQTAINGGTSFDTINTNVSLPEEFSLERCAKLIELDRLPWNEKDVVAVLQRGRTRALVNQIAIDVVPRLTYLLQRPVVRIAREAQRLCQRFNKCTKYDIQYATKIILPSIISDSCQKAALQATAMYAMSGETLKQSKSQRAGLRGLCVGKFHRWMSDAQLALCIHDQSAVYLTAVMENLLEEIVLQSMPPREGDSMLTSENLDSALSHNVELWGLLQPYSHLICSRTANGILALPHSTSPSREGSIKSSHRLSIQQQAKDCKHDRSNGYNGNGTLLKNLEQCLLATCVGSTFELGELISRVLHHQIKNGSSPSLAALTSGNLTGSAGVGKQAHPMWSREALRTLFYFMRCSQLEHADNPQSSPPALVLAHERPYLVLPPLIEWLRVSQTHMEYRQACFVDSDDVLQAARILLPGLDCPPRPFGIEDTLPVSGRSSPQTCGQKLKHDLAYRMLTSGNVDQITQAIGLLGAQKLDSPNDQGLTPLMWACLQGDEMAVRMLLDAGVNVNVEVPVSAQSGHQKTSLILPELAGWTALTFAVAQRHYALAHLLLERGAVVESPEMCTETPLQIAAMMGNHDLVNLLTAKGGDPFHSTMIHDAGFKQRGCASSLSLAASHGHRTILQAMLSRRRGRSEEVLSLEDFLAEGVQTPPGKNAQTANCSKSSMQLNNQQPIQSGSASWLGKLTKSQQKTLQDAMYQAAECGHVDITMDLRHLGIPWNTHVWTQTLAAAHDLRRKALVQLLLGDFLKHHLDDVNQEFIDDCLPLLFEIFRQSKNEVSTGQLAEILSHLYGEDPIPAIGGLLNWNSDVNQNALAPRIDAKYVNNPDLSDVQFVIDGRIFYGHKIVLINASEKFKRLLQDGTAAIEIDGVHYDVFQMMMEFLYNGKPTADASMDLSTLSQLLCAAGEFGLQPLRLHCELLVAQCLEIENCIDIYRFALHNEATELMRYCEGYFLQNLPTLINRVDGYRRLMMCNHASTTGLPTALSSELNKSNGHSSGAFDMADALLQTLTDRLQRRMHQNSHHKKP